ncbi:glycosyltransferase [Dysgonomonas sp. OttesenSCG-928-M03]|nr:glycosyltransferase [Dysgonomonas sp. OttesenSCG-928-M03]
MKILQINKFPSVKGGSEVVLFDTIDLLRRKGHEVVLLSTDEGNIVYNPTYTIHYSDKDSSLRHRISHLHSFFYNKKAIKQLESVIETEKPDIAHIHLYLNSLSQGILPILKKKGIPIVMTLHDYRQICPSYLLLDKNLNICERCIGGNYFNCMFTRCSKGSFIQSSLLTFEMYYRRFFYKTEKYVDKFICVSDFVYNKHKEFNPAITHKSEIISNPIQKPSTPPPFNRGDYLLYAGRLSSEKGLHTLLHAIKELPHIKLKIAGSGDLELNNIPPNVEILGFKHKDELSQLVENAMYTIIPSECYETFGLSCAESLALGTPVIASHIGALPEIVKHGENGFLFTPKSAEDLNKTIREAISLSDDTYIHMSNTAYESIQKFSGRNYINSLLKLYNELISRNS